MAMNRYITTAAVSLPAGAFTAEIYATGGGTVFGTGGWANSAGHYGSGGTVVIPARTPLLLDPAGQVFAAIGAGNLTLVTPAQESGGIDGTAN
jgi:hypothetical protein